MSSLKLHVPERQAVPTRAYIYQCLITGSFEVSEIKWDAVTMSLITSQFVCLLAR